MGLKTFTAWIHQHEHFKEKCPDNLIAVADAKLLSIWLSTCTAEVRRADGQPYPPRTLDNILSGLLQYIHSLPLEHPLFQEASCYKRQRLQIPPYCSCWHGDKVGYCYVFLLTFSLKSTTSFLGYMRYYSPCMEFITHQILSIAVAMGYK